MENQVYLIIGTLLITLLSFFIGRWTKTPKPVFPREVAEQAYSEGIVEIYQRNISSGLKEQERERLLEMIKKITGVDPSRPLP